MTARRIVLWRHGQTDGNLHGRMQGQADVPLNDTGRAQAAEAAPRLAQLQPTRLISSDLSRASETAAALAKVTGLDVSYDPRLREVDVGEWAGLTHHEVTEQFPGFLDALRSGEDFRRSATGETADEVGHRVAAALHEWADASDDEDVLVVVGHGMAWRVGVTYFLGGDYENSRALAGIHNCGWVVLDRTGPHWRLEAYNVTADLRDPRTPITR